jgi:predicted small secreted protein
MSMKKKIMVLIMVVAMACGLCACGNENWGFGNYTFKHVHFNDGITGVCADVDSWHDNDLGCEVHTDEFGTLYLSEGTYILIEQAYDCPFCSTED